MLNNRGSVMLVKKVVREFLDEKLEEIKSAKILL